MFAKPSDDLDGRVFLGSNGEEDFEGWIVLLKECAEVGFEAEVQSGERLQDTDGLRGLKLRHADAEVSARGEYRDERVHERAKEQDPQERGKDRHKLLS